MKKYKSKNSMTGNMIKTGIANIVGVGMIGATANAVSGLSAGTAKSIASTIPGLQSTALLGANLKIVKKSLKTKGGKFI